MAATGVFQMLRSYDASKSTDVATKDREGSSIGQGAELNPAGSRAQPRTDFELVRASVAIVQVPPRLNA